MRIRRVELWDFFHEDDNASPTAKFTNLSIVGANEFAIVSRTLSYTRAAGGDAATAYWTAGFTQSETLRYHVKISVVDTDAGWACGLIFQADAAAGKYLGNSRVLLIDADETTLYPSAANVLGAGIGTSATAHAAGNTYRLEIEYNPSTGVFTVWEDANLNDDRPDPTTVSMLAETDVAPLSGNGQLGVFCDDCDCEFTFYQVQRPDSNEIVDGSVSFSKFISKRPSVARFAVAVDDDKSITQEFQEHNAFELVIEDSSIRYREFFGLIEKTDWDTTTGLLLLEGRDTLQQMVVNEADHTTGGAVQQSAQIENIFNGNTDDLPTIDVKTAGDNYENDYEGRTVWEVVGSLARQLGHGIWQDKERKVKITDAYQASGITIDNDDDDVLDAQEIKDIYDLCNTAHVYHSVGDDLQTDGGSQGTYGKRGGPLYGATRVDQEIAAAGQAQDEGDFWINHYKDPVQALYIQVADYHELDIGQTVTLNIDHLGLAAASALVVEKHYEDGKPYFTFHCVIYAVNPLLRLNRDPGMTGHDGKRLASDANAWQA